MAWSTWTVLGLAGLQTLLLLWLMVRAGQAVALARAANEQARDVLLNVRESSALLGRTVQEVRTAAAEKATGETPWVGAFLPTDASAAALEAEVARSEDHAISAAGPIRFSSRPSSSSGRGLPPGRSRPPARSSGAR